MIQLIQILLFTIALIYLIIGSYTDLCSREVPDLVNFSFLAIALGFNAILSVIYWTWSYFLYSIFGLIIAVIIALFMYYTGQWGGGDAKMLFGIGALFGLPLQFPLTTAVLNWQLQFPVLISFLVYMIIIGGFYGIGWSIYLTIRSWKQFVGAFTEKIHEKEIFRMRIIIIGVTLIDLVSIFFVHENAMRLLIISFVLLMIGTFYLFIFIKIIEKIAMLKHVSPEQLTEGDWIADDIIIDDKYVTGPKELGISKEQIQELIGLQKKGKIEKVIIKQGIPFIPSFLITLFVSYFIGLGWLIQLLTR